MTAKHSPTDEQREQVELLAAFGIPQDDIARALDVAPKTLREHYRTELDAGTTKMLGQVAGALYRTAMGTDRSAVTAQIFIMKTRGGLKERTVLETPDLKRRNLAELSDQELAAIVEAESDGQGDDGDEETEPESDGSS